MQLSKSTLVPPLPRVTQPSILPQLPPKLIQQQRNFSSKVPSPPNSRKLQSQARKRTSSRGKKREVESPIDCFIDQLTQASNPLELVELISGREDVGFFYLSTRDKSRRKNRPLNPYDLKVVLWESVNRADYRTISAKGVSHFREGEEMEFTALSDWNREYMNYHHLLEIKTFAKFQLWKAFSTWRRNVRRDIIHLRKKNLQEKLFILNRDLSPALLTVSAECHAICQTQDLSSWQRDRIYSKQAFLDVQYQQMSRVSFTLAKFREAIKFFVIKACQRVLLRHMFIPDEVFRVTQQELTGFSEETVSLYETGLQKQEYSSALEERTAPLDTLEKSSYTEQAVKRSITQRLSRFIRLTDYMILSSMHGLSVNSLNNLLTMLYNCVTLSFTPKDLISELTEELRKKREMRERGEVAEEEEEETKEQELSVKPVFKTSLKLEGPNLYSEPSVEEFQQLMEEIGNRFKDCVLAMPRLIIDNIFMSYVRPVINKRREEGPPEPPSLEIILEDDPIVEEILHKMENTMAQAFEKVHEYARMWEPFRAYFEENQEMDLEKLMEEEHDVQFYADSLEKYDRQYFLAEKCPEKMDVGAFMVDTKELKTQLKPSTMRCLEAIHKILPKMAYKKLEKLIEFARDANARLETAPSSTKEYVENIAFINSVQEEMPSIDEETVIVRELYDLIQTYVVPCDAEDMAAYMTLEPGMASLRTTIDKSVSELEKKKNEFRTCLDNDITELGKEVREVKEKADQPMILDPNSDSNEITDYLSGLQQRMDSLNGRAQEYKSYQKQFQMEMTRFDELEETHAELKLKHTLWNVQGEFEQLSEDWKDTKLCDINPDSMGGQVTRYSKTTFQLDKGLPPNQIVPQLKAKVSQMKEKMPTITDLCNPNLKPRHWTQLSALVDREMNPDALTVGDLDKMDIFGLAEQVQEISGQASSEANLSNMLQMVDDIWKKTEFFVLNHRDSKDVFILGGTEDIQIALDDSLVQISTILGSRHVGPIKPKVEDMHKHLILFSETLDAWLDCQHQWLYLESIFTAPDIQRQLPEEAKDFAVVDKSWKEIMRDVKRSPKALRACTAPGRLEAFQQNNKLLEKIQKCLEEYLETKRLSFPRFYFLSNDELLEILSQTRNPQAVQPHLRKCFDAIAKLDFAKTKNDLGEEVFTNDILAMLSPEGERVPLTKGLKARGNVENWLNAVEDNMMKSLYRITKSALQDFEVRPRHEWCILHPSQVILTVSQIMWAKDLTEALLDEDDPLGKVKQCEEQCYANLNKLASMVRGSLSKLARNLITTLITIDVHARDIVTEMKVNETRGVSDFGWVKNLRYYWDTEVDNCFARMSNSNYLYGYEYLGACSRLVITPLTDRCYLCLMGALQLDLGGAPAGPAGTGKTETTKDLAKGLAKQCVVFNCSEGLDFKMMGRFFSGLAQSGAWCCFDEFNRIDIEVLSVIAQQILTIRNAKAHKLERFLFEGREIKLNKTCSVFITMNPGYAGRTELPDNLKALFRPFAMMVPDYALIAEVILYSEGFVSSRGLAQKMVQMYKLCSEQLSQQYHYDFGMRAVKSVLVMAGALKRENPDKQEDVVLIRALRDSNLPKFLKQDAVLFKAILQDLFPGIVLPEHDYGRFQTVIQECLQAESLQVQDTLIVKIIQLHETMIVRHGVMLVGPTGGGKTTCYQILRDTLGKMKDIESSSYYQKVRTYVLNPKSVAMGELYGEVNKLTLEWQDGLMAVCVREAVKDTTDDQKWIVCDGPVDALWIENMNTVLDDNKMLCLANSERIKLNPTIHMLFEVQDLAVASPSTVSRCGMVYIDPEELGWRPYVKTWIKGKIPPAMKEATRDYLFNLFDSYIDSGLKYVRKNCHQVIDQVDIGKVIGLCALLEVLLFDTIEVRQDAVQNKSQPKVDLSEDSAKLHPLIASLFIFCYTWNIGGNIAQNMMENWDGFIRDNFQDLTEARIPPSGDIFEHYVDLETKRFEKWEKILPVFTYNREVPYFDILVPTVDTVRYGFLMQKLLGQRRAVLFTGETGVGKSVIAKGQLLTLQKEGFYIPVTLNFSAQTSSKRTQEIIESKLEKKRKTILGAPAGKHIVLFVDDMNMPKLDRYGSQPPIELLRQYMDFRGFYDREKLFWKDIRDVTISAACGPPSGGRNPVTPRIMRHFTMFAIPSPSINSLKGIFNAIVAGFLGDFTADVSELSESIVNAAVDIYGRISTDLLPTPDKSHYIFNLRDLSKCIQGVLQADPSIIREKKQMVRLFLHESMRAFHDRLTNKTDKGYFYDILSEVSLKFFSKDIPPEKFESDPIIFGDFMKMGAPIADRFYEELADVKKLRNVLGDYLDDYNMNVTKEMNLVFFLDAVEHVSRIARMVRQPRGNALLVGIGGTGKQSLTRLASHMNGYKCFQIELNRGYNYESFREDLRSLYNMAGIENQDTVFLFTDTQIVVEEFLEDINNMLNSGEVPNLFEAEDYEKIINATRPLAKEVGILETDRDGIFNYFISRVQDRLHIVICMSPVGDMFRSRCRMFPSLVNCCTIDWFTEWPREALLSVAKSLFEEVETIEENLKAKIARMCVEIHTSVTNMADRFFAELRRRYYTTPTSYLELITLYLQMLDEKRKQLTIARDRVANGLKKLEETNALVDDMQKELTALEPELKKRSEETEALMINLEADQKEAGRVRKVVVKDQASAQVKTEETQAIAADAQKDLDTALPALENANKALDALDKSDISEVRTFAKPPPLVLTVMESVCILFAQRPDWSTSKTLLADPNFIKRLFDYDKDNIAESTLRKLKKYIENPNFNPEEVNKSSRACKSIVMWVIAIDIYAKVFKEVEPKRQRLEGAQAELAVVTEQLKKKEAELASVEEKIDQLKASFNESLSEKERLEFTMAQTAARLERAGRLTTALADEQIRWDENVKQFNIELGNVVGDVFIAAACVAYFGAFTASYRVELVDSWIGKCKELDISVSDNLSLNKVLADPYEIRQWNADGLPRDAVSTENAILCTRSRRWSLMIDPQDQANRWIKTMESKNGLKVIKLSDPNYLRTLENAIRMGIPVLLEEVEESLDPSLEPILLKQTFSKGGRLLIRLGDSDVDYDKNFRFYMTSKMSNPHYLPEVSIKVTIINFTVTLSGLEDQLLSDVVRLERPELEEKRNELIVAINSDKNQLKAIEDKILKMLFQAEGNVLDNEALVSALGDSKKTAGEIATRLAQAELTEIDISAAREKYRPVATRGSLIYFVIATLPEIDPMYQYSLKYFQQFFNACIESSEKSSVLETRLRTLLDNTTMVSYTNVARGLFEQHKLVFSFMLCCNILRESGAVSGEEWNFFLRGAAAGEKERDEMPSIAWLTLDVWFQCVDLEENVKAFRGLTREILATPIFITYGDLEVALNPLEASEFVDAGPLPDDIDAFRAENPDAVLGHWDERLTEFQKLILIKVFCEERVIYAASLFVTRNLGQAFVESPSIELNLLYQNVNKTTPLIFILSTGSDPMSSFIRFAEDMNYNERFNTISLGQGQGPVADNLISKAKLSGDWVFLQNCHLAASWMPELEIIVKGFQIPDAEINENFRLYLSSLPTASFPVSVLQNSVKVTNEPPKGLRANLKRSFAEMKPSFFEDHILDLAWRKMIFGVCLFHAVILERKKFGPLGWNIRYEFTDSDRETGLLNLKMFLEDGEIPWDALTFITGEITYGGRVTDDWDQRCLRTVLTRFFAPETIEPGYLFSESGIYYAPEAPYITDYREYIDGFPLTDDPEIFGMHDNANITYEVQEGQSLVKTILSVQPRMSTSGGGKTSDDIVYDLAESILSKFPDLLDIDRARSDLFEQNEEGQINSLSTVLGQEIDRYNALLKVVKSSMRTIQKAIKGFVVMSEQLEKVYTSFINHQVPGMWEKAAYPSLKPLGSWIQDLVYRIHFISNWMLYGNPSSYWISGFYFPQGFLTGTLQNHARKYHLPIDELSFIYQVQSVYRHQKDVYEQSQLTAPGEILKMDSEMSVPEDGVLVHGLYMDACRWNDETMQISNQLDREMNPPLPMMHMEPRRNLVRDPSFYAAPLYKTSARAGVLSTTGHSTNFVVAVNLPADKDNGFWISRGAALLTQLSD